MNIAYMNLNDVKKVTKSILEETDNFILDAPIDDLEFDALITLWEIAHNEGVDVGRHIRDLKYTK